jgi:cytochrome c oxidase accessory protein FixG
MALDSDRLSSIDEEGNHKTIIPFDVRGFFRKRRTLVYSFLLVFFLILPWITIHGKQALWLNISARSFTIFGLELYAHDAPLIFFIFAIFLLGIAYVTSVWGRIWCGWACPQTVFIDLVYRRIETWIEGSAFQRRKLETAAWTINKLSKKILKWTCFFIVSSLIAHSFAAYFIGAKPLLQMMSDPPENNWIYFVSISFFTALLLFDFGWFREQFCIIMCPYGRFQSVMMDDTSMAVIYDEKRGEPRKNLTAPKAPRGACVDCQRCVQVCPTGIDIRKGVQLECIACTACIDACNEIMHKVQQAPDLIRYANLNATKIRPFKPRALLYLSLFLICIFSFVFILASRSSLDISIVRAKESPYQIIQDTLALNHFVLHVKNQSRKAETFQISTSSSAVQIVSVENPLSLAPEERKEIHLFLKFPLTLLEAGQKKIELHIDSLDSGSHLHFQQQVELLGPSNKP